MSKGHAPRKADLTKVYAGHESTFGSNKNQKNPAYWVLIRKEVKNNYNSKPTGVASETHQEWIQKKDASIKCDCEMCVNFRAVLKGV